MQVMKSIKPLSFIKSSKSHGRPNSTCPLRQTNGQQKTTIKLHTQSSNRTQTTDLQSFVAKKKEQQRNRTINQYNQQYNLRIENNNGIHWIRWECQRLQTQASSNSRFPKGNLGILRIAHWKHYK